MKMSWIYIKMRLQMNKKVYMNGFAGKTVLKQAEKELEIRPHPLTFNI